MSLVGTASGAAVDDADEVTWESMNAHDALKTVFREALALPPDTDLDGLAYRSIPEWDSVAHMHLVGEIESAFDVMLETQEVVDMSSYVKAREILRGHGVSV